MWLVIENVQIYKTDHNCPVGGRWKVVYDDGVEAVLSPEEFRLFLSFM